MVSGTGLIMGGKVTMATDMLQPALHTDLLQMDTEISNSQSAKPALLCILELLFMREKCIQTQMMYGKKEFCSWIIYRVRLAYFFFLNLRLRFTYNDSSFLPAYD